MSVTIAEKLAYVASRQEEDQSKLLARAFDTGVDTLYREALVEAYLAGQCSRQDLVREIGAEAVAEVEARKEAILGDFEWGLRGA